MMPCDPSIMHVLCDDQGSGIGPEFEKKKSGLPGGSEINRPLFPS